jgi:hypothetical protein
LGVQRFGCRDPGREAKPGWVVPAIATGRDSVGAFKSAHDWLLALISPCGVCICTNCRRLKLHMQDHCADSFTASCCAKARPAPPRADLLAVAALCSRTGGIGRCSASASPIEATPASSRASGVAITDETIGYAACTEKSGRMCRPDRYAGCVALTGTRAKPKGVQLVRRHSMLHVARSTHVARTPKPIVCPTALRTL